MKLPIALLATLLAFVTSGSLVSAQVAYGLYADAGNTPGDGYYIVAAGDVFTSSASFTANSVQFYGEYNDGGSPSNTFTADLYNVSAGTPTTLVQTIAITNLSTTDLGAGIFSDSYLYEGTLATPFTVNAGTSYYLDISDATSPYKAFLLGYYPEGTTGYSRFSYGGFGPDDDQTAAIMLYGDGDSLNLSTDNLVTSSVPEPTNWAVGMIALVLLCAFRARTARA